MRRSPVAQARPIPTAAAPPRQRDAGVITIRELDASGLPLLPEKPMMTACKGPRPQNHTCPKWLKSAMLIEFVAFGNIRDLHLEQRLLN